MAPMGYFLAALAKVIDTVLFIYMWIIIIRAVLSWVSPDPYNPIVRFINNITEPVLYQIRRRLPVSFGGIDLSPVVVLLIIVFLQSFVVRSLLHFAQGFIQP
ncbi:MAG: YggT family protein [Desulfobacterales bacterium]|nr:YggT family protein [Desulfobacterales bacterium]